MILVSRNFMNNKNDTKITDIDINSISISVMDPKSMPSKQEIEQEYAALITEKNDDPLYNSENNVLD